MEAYIHILIVTDFATGPVSATDDSDMTASLNAALPTLTNSGFRDDIFMIELNDSGWSFDEIADYLDRIDNIRY